MNFLAHIYLSGDNELVRIGNFMADGIRGKEYESYPADIQKGIMLHRAIDSFTDAHPIFRAGTKRLHSKYHHYSGVVMDLYYDHFLAKNWSRYSTESLESFADLFYRSLEENFELLSAKTKSILPIMKDHNWLVSYATIEGLSRIFWNMDRRTGNESKMSSATTELLQYYNEYELEFSDFFQELYNMATQKLSEL
ncbi:MAG: DUF479 domain-containing protein [Flavobacterium sp.]|nr:MAG: DUF479 domain-containing protein [Flavobacterium sp.]